MKDDLAWPISLAVAWGATAHRENLTGVAGELSVEAGAAG